MTRLPVNPLIPALSAGRPQAFAALFDRRGEAMLRVGRAMVGSREDAEDLVQEVFVSLVRSRHRLAYVEDLDAYLFGMLRHSAGHLRARRESDRRRLAQLALIRPIEQLQAPESSDDLDSALAKLPGEQREIVALKIQGGLTFAGIAQVLAINPNTAASRYRYALENLRKSLEKPS
jgi:RNA polymerase sigma-70 factor (ECF subfamily)